MRKPTTLIALILIMLIALVVASEARATEAQARWSRSWSTYYGPGLYGNRTACGHTLVRRTWAVAHRTLPCGTVVELRYRHRTFRARVIDRGPFGTSAEFDLTERLAKAMCACRRWGNWSHAWRTVG